MVKLRQAPQVRTNFTAFSQRGTNKPHNEDALLLNGKVHQGSVRESGVVEASRQVHFAIADGVSSGTNPRTASRRLLDLLQARLSAAVTSPPLLPILHQVQQDYVSLGADTDLHGMASTLIGIQVIGNEVTIFNVGDSRAYLLTADANGPQIKLLSRDHTALNDMIDDGEITLAQSENAASFLRGLSSQFMADADCDDFRVNIITHTWQTGERILLCSDGLNEVLFDSAIAKALVNHSLADLMQVCKASRRAGGCDDFSVLVLAQI